MGGAYLLLPSYHITLPSPFQYRKRNSGSKVRHAPACLHTQHTHTLSRLSLGVGPEQEGRWARAEVRVCRASPPTHNQDPGCTHLH